MNAMKHGLRATDELFVAHLKRRERAAFEEFRASLHNEYRPQTEHEKLLVDRIAIEHFRLFRLYRLEDAALSETLTAVSAARKQPFGTSSSVVPHLDRFSRYDWRIERQLRMLQNRLRMLYYARGDSSLNFFLSNE